MSFDADLNKAKRIEFLIAQGLLKNGALKVEQSEGRFSEYDLLATYQEVTIKYECKHDKQTPTSKNVCVEVARPGKNGERLPAGLSSTGADYYLQTMAEPTSRNNQVWRISTDTLRDLVRNYDELNDPTFGDGNCIISLVPVDVFKQHAEPYFTIVIDEPKQTPKADMLAMVRGIINKT